MLSVIGIGPGSQAMMTMEAVEALQAAEIVVGYKTYTHLVKAFTGDKQVIKTGMCKEIERCQAAIKLAQAGHNVALISSGDAGIYGMAGLVLELVNKQQLDIEVRLIPGMTASIAAASLLGAPLMHDFCHISLSDLLTPWPVIEKRIVAAGEADFVICFYNPRSRGREGHLARAFALLAASKSADTPVGVVKSAGRKKQEKWLTTLGEMDFAPVDMTSLVIVGNKATYIDNGLMITPRGYALRTTATCWLSGAPAMRGRSASSWTPPTCATPCRWRPLPASGWPAISAGRYAAGEWSGSRWRSGSERSAPAG